MSVKLSIVCENTVGRPIAAIGEHGFACLVEAPSGTWLFDTGRGNALMHNLEALGHDPHQIEHIVLSHGHNDHTGGLLPLLTQIGPRPVYAHPGIFAQRYWQGLHEQRDISIPDKEAELADAGANFLWREDFGEIGEGLYFSGVIPRNHPAETGDPHLVCRQGTQTDFAVDPFMDDAAIAVQTARGLVIILGCAHAGLINTVEHFRRALNDPQIHAIVGGTHLGPASDAQFNATLDYLDRLSFDRLGVSHCTGQIRAAQIYARYPNKVVFASVGTILDFH